MSGGRKHESGRNRRGRNRRQAVVLMTAKRKHGGGENGRAKSVCRGHDK